MKLQVTKVGSLTLKATKTAPAAKTARGFIDCDEIRVKVFSDSNFKITGFELKLGKTVKVIEKDTPFIMWSQVENAVEAFINSKDNGKNIDPLEGLGAVKKGRKRTRAKYA